MDTACASRSPPFVPSRSSGIVVGGIGRRALERLADDRIHVFQAEHATVGQTMAAYRAGSLRPLSMDAACAHGGHSGHGHGGGCPRRTRRRPAQREAGALQGLHRYVGGVVRLGEVIGGDEAHEGPLFP